jgi:uncharacterized membrane protein YdjX (TVP38/TMEM64 family)
MKRQKARIFFWGSFVLLATSGLILHVFWGESLLNQALFHLENVMTDGTRTRETILSFGFLAPLMFMVLQILQVLFAPVPGEATVADAFRGRFSKTKIYRKFNHLTFKGDFVIPFVLFLFPGFPKDSLSYLLGLSTMPFKVFIFIASIARMPGTLMLSFEGAQVYERNYLELLILLVFSAIVALPCYLYRRQILEKLTHYSSAKKIEQESESDE